HGTDRGGRSLRGDQGAGRGLLDLAGEVPGGGDRMGQALSQPVPRGERDRDPPGVRGGRFRARAQPPDARPGRAHARPVGGEEVGGETRRFMMLMIPKGYESAPPGTVPDAGAVAAMMKYNESLQRAGVLLALDGLHPPSMGARVSFPGGKP